MRIASVPNFRRLRRAPREILLSDVRIDDSVLKVGDGPGRNMVVHVGEGCIRHLLQRLNRISHLDAERGDVLVERRDLRVESLN